jgi:hypothetical protein
MNAINIGPMSYRRIMDKRNNLQLSLVASRDPFLLLSRPNVGSVTKVKLARYTSSWIQRGRRGVHTNTIHFCPMLYICIVDKSNPFYLIFLKDNAFFYCKDQIWVHLLVVVVLDGYYNKASYWSIDGRRWSNNRNNLLSCYHMCIRDKCI